MKKPFVGLAQLETMVQQYPTPFHLYDEKGIRENARRLKKAFSWNKGFKEYFAVKATPNPAILKILKEEGCGADCSSYTELMLAETVGFCGNEIMFSSNVTPADDFRYARKLGAIINLDDITHIEFLDKAAGIPSRICCRYNPGGLFIVNNAIMDTPEEQKFGFTREQLFKGFQMLMSKGVTEFGLHAFLVSNSVENQYYPQLARQLFELARDLHQATGARITFINLSGGVGIPYHPDQKPADIERIGREVKDAFEEILVPAGLGDVCIFTELGRFMLAPYGCLVSRVIHQKHIYRNYIGLDACAANLMRPAIYKAYHHITVMGREKEPCDLVYDVTGSLCENNDKFAVNRSLPKVETGDLVVIHDTGAHGHAMGYNYNGKLRSAEILLREDGTTQLIRRAETPADYFATLDFTGCFNKD